MRYFLITKVKEDYVCNRKIFTIYIINQNNTQKLSINKKMKKELKTELDATEFLIHYQYI